MTIDQHWNGHHPQTDYPYIGEETVIAHTVMGLVVRREPAGMRGVVMMFPNLLFLPLGIVLLSDLLHVLLQTEPYEL